MLTEHLQLLRDAPLALVYGYSMGGCLALEWAVSFSRQVARASVSGTLLCGIAALWYCIMLIALGGMWSGQVWRPQQGAVSAVLHSLVAHYQGVCCNTMPYLLPPPALQ